MSNFQRARNRILYSQNKYETYTMNEHTDRIKRMEILEEPTKNKIKIENK